MSNNADLIYGTSLTREELEGLLPENEPIPFVFVYSCAISFDYTQDELHTKLQEIKKEIPDFAGLVNNNEGTPYDSLIILFTKKQWSIHFKWKEDEVWVQMSFGNHGKPWGSNYALWLLHQKWITEKLNGTVIRPLMDHVDPVDIRLPER